MTDFTPPIIPRGWELLRERRYSTNPGDGHLRVLLCRDKEDHNRYVTWVYNTEAQGCGSGHYIETCPDHDHIVESSDAKAVACDQLRARADLDFINR